MNFYVARIDAETGGGAGGAQRRDVYAAAHTVKLLRREIHWCGKIYLRVTAFHNPEGVQGSVSMCQPNMAGELMQFLEAANWMRKSVPAGCGGETPT